LIVKAPVLECAKSIDRLWQGFAKEGNGGLEANMAVDMPQWHFRKADGFGQDRVGRQKFRQDPRLASKLYTR
jgi:hypothetical protein